MKQKQRKHPMEVLWVCVAVMCLIVAIKRTISLGFDEGIAMYIGTIIALLMFLWRRHIRKNEEEDNL